MFYELRQYTIRPGKMAEWLEYMEGTIIPYQEDHPRIISLLH